MIAVRRLICLWSVVLLAGCSAGDDKGSLGRSGSRTRATIVVNGETVEVARLTDAVSGLCKAREQAAKEPAAARVTYDRRSRYGVDTTARILPPTYTLAAAAITEAAGRVQAGFEAEPASATLADELGILTERLREGLARIGVATKACDR